MHFQVSRNGQTYGPYTLEDLERYVASGNVLPTDLAKSDDMPDWLPVAQILGQRNAAAPPPGESLVAQDPAYAAAPLAAVAPFAPATPAPYQSPFQTPAPYAGAPNAAALAAARYPDPPNLNWGLVLLISLFTNGLFQIIWDFVQAAWMKKVQPDATAMTKYITGYALYFGGVVVAVVAGGVAAATSQNGSTPGAGTVIFVLLAGLCFLGGLVMVFVARFSMRASLEQHFNGPEPVGLRLSGIMTFFFGSLYFQYHLNRINTLKQAARMGVPPTY